MKYRALQAVFAVRLGALFPLIPPFMLLSFKKLLA